MMDGTKTTKTEPLLLDEREAARRLGVSPRSLWQLRKDGRIEWVPVGGRVLYEPAALAAFITRQRRPATAEPDPTEDFSEKGRHCA